MDGPYSWYVAGPAEDIRSKDIRNGPDQVLSQEMENPYFQFFRAFTRTNFDWSFTQISVKTSYKDLPKQRKLIYLLKS